MLTLRSQSVDFWERHAPHALAHEPEVAALDPVLRSWQRAASLGVRPDGDAPPEGVDANALVSLRAGLDEVCTLGARLLEPLSAELTRKNMVALLTDARGTILLARGGGAFAKTAARARLVEGAHWGEPVRGTNAIGTAIVERCPVAVVGPAHYERVNHGLFCYAVPIWGPDGDVVAVVDVTGHLEDEDPFAELAVTSVAYRLEHALRVHAEARGGGRASDAAPPLRGRPASRAASAPATASAGGSSGGASAGREEGDAFAPLLATDAATLAAKALARRVAPSDLPVLLLAETGTGKELLARAIHGASDRRDGPFVPINCGAVAPTLLESELFGYSPGAFTGARASGYSGKVGAAKGGTLFLDEVAEMPPPLQAALLRLLDDGVYFPVGDNRPRQADVRIVCATCRDLVGMTRAGTFRTDLFYRIKGATLSLPPLRERTDRLELARGLLVRLAHERRLPCPRLSAASEALLEGWSWPGNVRELKTALHHALVLGGGGPVLEPAHFPADFTPAADRPAPDDPRSGMRALGAPAADGAVSRSGAERGAVEQALLLAAGNLSDAARRLGVARSTLYRLMRRHGLAGALRDSTPPPR
jgi:transcriptional regulator of acetoin/glycerol metabolism